MVPARREPRRKRGGRHVEKSARFCGAQGVNVILTAHGPAIVGTFLGGGASYSLMLIEWGAGATTFDHLLRDAGIPDVPMDGEEEPLTLRGPVLPAKISEPLTSNAK